MKYNCIILIFALLSCTTAKNEEEAGLSPEQALQTFKLPAGFKIELLAAEPLVADPVAMEIDEKGDIYVVEMHGYPEDLKGSGIVKLLKDTNGDNKPDQSIVFADSLVLPSGIMKWKKGVLVVDVPDIWYLEDTNGDGKADRKEKVLTGFARTNPQHVANTPLLGVDNWIYIAHQGVITPKVSMQFNDTGSAVRYANNPAAVRLPRDADGRNVRLKPDSYELEMLSGGSQYGHTFDSWGHPIYTSNANHLYHEVVAASYLKRNPSLLVAESMQSIPDHGDAAEVFPITDHPEHQLLTDVGVITSSCGVTWYQGGLFPDSFNNVTFIAEPVHNLVHADHINPNGASYIASRVYENKEFLASTDAWFRPVQFYVGPDGALYVIDYYRQIIEHPEWMSDEVNQSGALYNGSKKGRIYRVTPNDAPAADWMNSLKLGEQSNQGLVQTLSNKNIWWRRHAQRLLSDRNAEDIPLLLKNFVDTSRSPEGIVHALWLLHSMKKSDSSLLVKALKHPVAGVRENAVKIAENFLSEWPGITAQLYSMKEDPDAMVRYQLLCTLGSVNNATAETERMQVLEKDIEDKWVQIAMLTAANGKELSTLKKAIIRLGYSETAGKKLFFENCAAVIALSQNAGDIKNTIQLAIDSKPDSSLWWQSAILQGLLKGISLKGKPAGNFGVQEQELLGLFTATAPDRLRKPAIELLKIFRSTSGSQLNKLIIKARMIAADSSMSPAFRQDAINLLSLDTTDGSDPLLERLLQPREPEALQLEAIRIYAKRAPEKAGRYSIAVWKNLAPAVRNVTINTFYVSIPMRMLLLDAIEKGQVQTGSIGWVRSVELMNDDNPGVRNKARKLFADRLTDRGDIIKKYDEALSIKGDAVKGKEIFKANCARCHEGVEGRIAFGPGLASIRNRESKFILADILDPNRSIADRYELWTITLIGGKTLSGTITTETSATITVTNAEGKAQTIPRQEIQQIEASSVSAMPVGLETSISVKDMANLIAFLKGVSAGQ